MTEQATDSTAQKRVCPRCGTRVAPGATRCVVCGAELQATAARPVARGASQVSLSVPVALALLAGFALLSSGLTYFAARYTSVGNRSTPTTTPTSTPTETATPPPTFTPTPAPTETPLPPIDYVVVLNDTCGGLALRFGVSVRSITELNNLTTDCVLSVGMSLKIPHPTPTPSPVPTQTLAPNQATEQACPRDNYTVQSGDTLTGIARAYNVGTQAIMDYNNMANDSVFAGQILVIPLCKRNPTPGPTPTPTTPPPYPAPNLLLPRDGDRFTQADDTVTLQWASVGPLRDNEAYQITIEDISDVTGSVRLIAQATDTKYIVPTSFRPADVNPHILRWWVAVVRQTDTDVNGNPVYTTAGAASAKRDFTWSGAPPIASPTPAA